MRNVRAYGRVVAACVLVCLVSVVFTQSSAEPVAAEVCPANAVPPGVLSGSSVETRHTGILEEFTPEELFEQSAAEHNSGSWSLVAGPAAGPALSTVGGVALAFIFAGKLGCGLGQWLHFQTGAATTIPTAPVPSNSVVVTTSNCNPANFGFPGESYMGPITSQGCVGVYMPGISEGRTTTSSSAPSGRYVVADDIEREVGGIVLPAKPHTDAYPSGNESWVVGMCRRAWSYCSGAYQGDMAAWNPITLAGQGGGYPLRYYSPGMLTSERLLIRCGQTEAQGWGVGGVCGVPPKRLAAVVNPETNSVDAIFQPYPKAATHGWQREHVTIARCTNTGSTHTYVTAVSAPWWDAAPSELVPTVACGDGLLVTGMQTMTRPVNWSGCTAFGSCSQFTTSLWNAPSTWLTATNRPPHTECLRVGVVCADPPSDDGSGCKWGGRSAPGLCDSPTLDLTSVTSSTPTVGVELVPTVDQIVSTATPIVAEPVPEPTVPPPGPGTGVTVQVPIDDGGESGPRVICPDIATTTVGGLPCIPEVEADCFGATGWGWFNPVNWVVKPGKCVLRWAFVPDDPLGWVEDQKEALSDEFPFSQIGDMVAFADTATTPTGTANSCIGSVDLVGLDGAVVADTESLCVFDSQAVAALAGSSNATLRQLIWFVMVGLTVLGFGFSTVRMIL